MKKDSVIVSEGYLDMITPFCCGIDNIVASLGTALTPRQISLIKRYTDNIILVFDADSAGETATIRALDLVLENGLRPEVLSMPEGFDLDAAVRQKGKDYLMHLLEGKQNFFDYKLSILTKHYSKEKIQDRVKIAQRMLASIRKIPDKIERDEYVKLLSAALKIKEATLLAELKDEQRSQRQLMPQLDQQETIPIVERLIFKFIFTNKKVYDFISQNINESDFANSLSRKTYSLINAKNQEQGYLGYREFLSLVQDRNINSFLSQIILEDTGDLNKTVLQDCVEKLQKRRIKLLKNELREKIKKAEKNKSIEEVKKLMKEYKKINSEVLHG
jgi:DNA primase